MDLGIMSEAAPELAPLMQLLFDAPPGIFSAAVIWGVVGLLMGSFLNVVIYRLPIMMQRETDNFIAIERDEPLPHTQAYNLIAPRSACPACGHALSATENIPLLSWALQRGRCRHCGASISARYPLVEALTALLSAWVVWRLGSGFESLVALPLVWALVAMSFIDFDTQMLPDDLTLPLVWLGLLFNLVGGFVPLQEAVIGAAAGYLVLWGVYWVYRLVTGKEGIGYGDFKLLAALGAWLGWTMLPLIVLLSSLVGAVVGVTLILLRRHQRGMPIPFGPFLAMAGVVALLYGPAILAAWLGHIVA
jgi:leader peptidase (prepilin peptidase)/N-methyltransferase